MKKLAAMALAFAVLPFVGCTTSPTGGGGPGEGTFTFTPPGGVTGTVSVKQGEKVSEKVKVDHKDNKGNITFSVDEKTVPKHVKIEFNPAVVKPDMPDTTMKIDVGDEAAEGEQKVQVIATPEKGNPTHKEFTLKITKK
jgi:hypothetical protein